MIPLYYVTNTMSCAAIYLHLQTSCLTKGRGGVQMKVLASPPQPTYIGHAAAAVINDSKEKESTAATGWLGEVY